MFTVRKSYRFTATHQLTEVAATHPCARPGHGHTYAVTIELAGQTLNPFFFLRELEHTGFDGFSERVLPALSGNLNLLCPFETTPENLARWLYETCCSMYRSLDSELAAVRVYKDAADTLSFAEFRPSPDEALAIWQDQERHTASLPADLALQFAPSAVLLLNPPAPVNPADPSVQIATWIALPHESMNALGAWWTNGPEPQLAGQPRTILEWRARLGAHLTPIAADMTGYTMVLPDPKEIKSPMHVTVMARYRDLHTGQASKWAESQLLTIMPEPA